MAKIKNLLFVIVLLFVASTAFSQIDTSKYKVVKSQVDGKVIGVENKVAIVGIDSGKAQAGLTYILNFPDSVKTYISDAMRNLWKFRDTITYRDTLTESTPFKSYNFGSQYELITITLTKNDTCAVVWDSVKFYSVSSYGDTALTGVRYTETFTDSTFVRVNWSVGTRTSSKKVLFLDPICKFMHIRLENFALTNRSVILTIRGAKR